MTVNWRLLARASLNASASLFALGGAKRTGAGWNDMEEGELHLINRQILCKDKCS